MYERCRHASRHARCGTGLGDHRCTVAVVDEVCASAWIVPELPSTDRPSSSGIGCATGAGGGSAQTGTGDVVTGSESLKEWARL